MPSSINGQHFLFGTFGTWTNNGVGMWRDAGNQSYTILLKSDSASYLTKAFGFTADQWYHIAIVYTGTQWITYINGTSQTVDYGGWGTITHPAIYLGNSLYSSAASTKTDEAQMVDFRFYVTALSKDDVLDIYNTKGAISNGGDIFARQFVENKAAIQITNKGLIEASEIREETTSAYFYNDKHISGRELIEF